MQEVCQSSASPSERKAKVGVAVSKFTDNRTMPKKFGRCPRCGWPGTFGGIASDGMLAFVCHWCGITWWDGKTKPTLARRLQ